MCYKCVNVSKIKFNLLRMSYERTFVSPCWGFSSLTYPKFRFAWASCVFSWINMKWRSIWGYFTAEPETLNMRRRTLFDLVIVRRILPTLDHQSVNVGHYLPRPNNERVQLRDTDRSGQSEPRRTSSDPWPFDTQCPDHTSALRPPSAPFSSRLRFTHKPRGNNNHV